MLFALGSVFLNSLNDYDITRLKRYVRNARKKKLLVFARELLGLNDILS